MREVEPNHIRDSNSLQTQLIRASDELGPYERLVHEKADLLIRRLADFGFNNIQGGAGNNRPARSLLRDIMADIEKNQMEITTWMGVMEKALSNVRS
ncbi:hypothetical protein CC2G_006487 [Coprinopsis cinerea AmutBmut pab1-1]|nr:hypothetical protein CC2G_006487 [Coprinopsis cinerea AmutBmut pab1-1]